MRLLVCGDRNWNDIPTLTKVLDELHAHRPISLLIEGGAKGADRMAAQWAASKQITIKEFPADWNKFKKAAGPIRNQQMLDEGSPQYVLAFHNDITNSKGTRDMLRRAQKASIKTGIVFTILGEISFEQEPRL